MEARAAVPLDALIADIRDEIRVYTGAGQLADDLTLLALRRKAGRD